MAGSHNKGAQKTLFLNFTLFEIGEELRIKNVNRSDKIVFHHRFNIANKFGFLSDLQNIILFD